MTAARSSKLFARLSVSLVIAIWALSCSGSDEDGSGSCPEGFTPTRSMNEAGGDGMATRDEAVSAELERLQAQASDEAIGAAVAAGQPGPNPGTERVVVDTDEFGEVTMILAPLDPGWTVERSSWCGPI